MKVAAGLTAATLGGIAALHAGWGVGSTFPYDDERRLADTVAGTTAMPDAPASFAVAGLLATAAGLVADLVPVPGRLRRVGLAGVAAVLSVRGLAGLTGMTRTLVPWQPSERFERLDRRYYGPLCLVLAAGAALGLRR